MVDMFEVERKIGYWQHVLSKIERRMLDEQSERTDIKHRIAHLHLLQDQSDFLQNQMKLAA